MRSKPLARAPRAQASARKNSSVSGGVSQTELAKLGRQVQGLVDELMRNLLDAITTASTQDIGEMLGAIDDGAPIAVVAEARPKRNAVARSGARSAPRAAMSSRSERLERNPPSMSPQSPFDITSPGDLLATVQALGRRLPFGEESSAQAAPAPASTPELPSMLMAPPPAPPSTSDIEAASERRPRVVLREGERLLSSTGSGVVIRRDRRIAPRT
jgi:hypothetical protein